MTKLEQVDDDDRLGPEAMRTDATTKGGPASLYRAFLCCLALALVACDAPRPGLELALPERAPDAPGGLQVAEEVEGLDLEAREERIYTEIASGNMPSWQRVLHPVETSAFLDGTEATIEFWVTPDYLAVGSDEDYVLTPLSPQTGQRVADLLDASLPTPRMVDAVWRAADVRLAPQRIEPDEFMRTVGYYLRHDRLIRGERRLRGAAAGAFVAGHKKDVVLSTSLADDPGKVAIYGWHRPDGSPIQSLSTVLADNWVGFNHGVRLVSRSVTVDGIAMDLTEVLQDAELAALVSTEGPIANPRYPLERAGAPPEAQDSRRR